MTINEAYGEVQASFIEWGGLFKDPNYARTDRAVSWQGASGLVVPDDLTIEDLRGMSEERQFSFRVTDDDSILQIAYRFNRDEELADARLGFFKFPEREECQDLIVEPESDDDSSGPVSWLRLDFAKDAPVKVGHAPCHLHLSGFPSTRFAVFGVPSPSQFVEFVVSHFYPSEYSAVRLSGDGNFSSFDRLNAINSRATKVGIEPGNMLRCLPHLFTPGN
jgi:hypothetical protein